MKRTQWALKVQQESATLESLNAKDQKAKTKHLEKEAAARRAQSLLLFIEHLVDHEGKPPDTAGAENNTSDH